MFLDLFRKKRKVTELKNHQFFSTMNFWVSVQIDILPIQSRMKKNVISKFLKIKFEVFEKKVREYITTLECSDDCVLNFETIMVDCLKEADELALQNSIPTIFLEKFKRWDEQHSGITFNSISDICNSKFYTSNYEKTNAILDILLFSFRLTIIDAEKTISEMNGDLERVLKGTIYDT